MTLKTKVTFRMTDTAIEYIDKHAEKHGLTKTDSIEKIIREHKNQSQSEIDIIANSVIDKFEEKYSNFFTRLRLATNFTDKNTQILLEMMNSLCFSLDAKLMISSVLKTPVFEGAEEEITQKIAKYKQIKDNKVKNSEDKE